MRKVLTPLILIITIASCSKNNTQFIATVPVDSTASNVYLDPGTVTATILTDTFRSFNLIHAYDNDGIVNITARTLFNNDTCAFSISFLDTLRTNIPYANYSMYDSLGITRSAYYFSLGFFDGYLGTEYLTGVKNNFTGDTLLITTFDKSKHLLAGTFKATMTASNQASPNITQTSAYVTGSFNTYYNTGK